jgi:hypothetical protein
MVVAGFGLTLAVFYPGLTTIDAGFIYQDTIEGFRGDWQSPMMTALWALIDPIAPGTASMFLLIVTVYWLAFGLLAFGLARASLCFAATLLLLAATPPAFVMLGVVSRSRFPIAPASHDGSRKRSHSGCSVSVFCSARMP